MIYDILGRGLQYHDLNEDFLLFWLQNHKTRQVVCYTIFSLSLSVALCPRLKQQQPPAGLFVLYSFWTFMACNSFRKCSRGPNSLQGQSTHLYNSAASTANTDLQPFPLRNVCKFSCEGDLRVSMIHFSTLHPETQGQKSCW